MIKNTLKLTDENGFASLVVAFIFVLVMSMVTVGFAQLARHEQQNSLNKQLADQAYYAAETGINEIKTELPNLEAAYATNPTLVDPTKCLGSPYIQNVNTANNPNAGVVDTNSDVTFTCALVNLHPNKNVFSGGNQYGAINDIFTTKGLDHLTFMWGSNDTVPQNQPRTSGGFPQQNQWGSSPPVVQFSITPVDPGGPGTNFIRNDLIQNTFTTYLYPGNGSAIPDPINTAAPVPVGSIAYSPDGVYPNSSTTNAPIVDAAYPSGNSEYPYQFTITGLPGNAAVNETWIVHIVWFYDSPKVQIQGYALTGSTALDLSSGEAQVDVTGKAKNVSKRIVEYLPVSQTTSSGQQSTQNGIDTLPFFAVSSGATCSKMATHPAAPGAGIPESTAYEGPSVDCKLSN